jgi:hypothetical protein
MAQKLLQNPWDFALSQWMGSLTTELRICGAMAESWVIFSQGDCHSHSEGVVCVYIYEYSPVNQHSYGKWPSYRWFTYLKWWFSAFALNERWPQREGSLGYSHVGMDGRFSNNHWKAKLERQLRGPAARYPEQDLQMVNSCKLHIELLPSGKLR